MCLAGSFEAARREGASAAAHDTGRAVRQRCGACLYVRSGSSSASGTGLAGGTLGSARFAGGRELRPFAHHSVTRESLGVVARIALRRRRHEYGAGRTSAGRLLARAGAAEKAVYADGARARFPFRARIHARVARAGVATLQAELAAGASSEELIARRTLRHRHALPTATRRRAAVGKRNDFAATSAALVVEGVEGARLAVGKRAANGAFVEVVIEAQCQADGATCRGRALRDARASPPRACERRAELAGEGLALAAGKKVAVSLAERIRFAALAEVALRRRIVAARFERYVHDLATTARDPTDRQDQRRWGQSHHDSHSKKSFAVSWMTAGSLQYPTCAPRGSRPQFTWKSMIAGCGWPLFSV